MSHRFMCDTQPFHRCISFIRPLHYRLIICSEQPIFLFISFNSINMSHQKESSDANFEDESSSSSDLLANLHISEATGGASSSNHNSNESSILSLLRLLNNKAVNYM